MLVPCAASFLVSASAWMGTLRALMALSIFCSIKNSFGVRRGGAGGMGRLLVIYVSVPDVFWASRVQLE